MSYAEVMREYARQRKLHRRVVPLPRQTLRASRMLLGMLTPVYGRVAAAMIDSLRNETVVRDASRPRSLCRNPTRPAGSHPAGADERGQRVCRDVLE